MFFSQSDQQVAQAFIDCITEHGAAGVSVDELARKLGWSRSSLYRAVGSWPQMVRFGYEVMLEWVDAQVPERGADPRVELEQWWATLCLLLGSPSGQAVLAMRALAVLHYGEAEISELESARLRALKRWCAGSGAVFRGVWSLLRAAGGHHVPAAERLELREIVWLIVGRNDADKEPDFASALSAVT
jgi:AcrR family transcriptional regulator